MDTPGTLFALAIAVCGLVLLPFGIAQKVRKAGGLAVFTRTLVVDVALLIAGSVAFVVVVAVAVVGFMLWSWLGLLVAYVLLCLTAGLAWTLWEAARDAT